MRFLIIVKATERSETGATPTTREFSEMGAFNEGLVRDGMLLSADGVSPSSQGVRLRFATSPSQVVPGPFTPATELLAGFWIVSAPSQEAVIERFRNVPFHGGEEIEIRRLLEAEDFGESFTEAARAQEERLRAQLPT